MLVRHPTDSKCAETASAYKRLLRPKDDSFLDCPLDALVNVIESCTRDAFHTQWLLAFRKRYLDLALSEEEWRRHAL